MNSFTIAVFLLSLVLIDAFVPQIHTPLSTTPHAHTMAMKEVTFMDSLMTSASITRGYEEQSMLSRLPRLQGTQLSAAKMDSQGSFSVPPLSRHPSFATVSQRLHFVASAVQREVRLACDVMEGNVFATVIFGMISTAAYGVAQNTHLSSLRTSLLAMAKSFVWFVGYGYFFDLANQISGIEEDSQNCADIPSKQKRPLVTGLMTIEGATKRCVVTGVLWLASSWKMGGLPLTLPTLLWIASSQLYNFHDFSQHFATKNYVSMTLGSISMLMAARSMSGDTLSSVVPPILAATWAGLVADIQDFRDETGDRVTGRRTTAVVMGVEKARKVWAAQIMVMTAVGANYLRKSVCFMWADSLFGLASAALAVTTVRNKTVEDDIKSYRNYLVLVLGLFARSAFWAQKM